MPKRKQTPIEAFLALSDAEKEKAVAEFDQEFIMDTFHPLTPAQRRLWERAKRKRGRPKVGRGAKRVMLSIEGGLLKEADALARARGLSRSQLVAVSLRQTLARVG